MIINDYSRRNNNFGNLTAKTKRFTFSGKKLVVFLILLLTVLIGSQLALSNYLSTKGQKVWEFDQAAQNLENENFALKAQIARSSSLKSLSERAMAIGLVKAGDFVYIKDHSSLAFKK